MKFSQSQISEFLAPTVSTSAQMAARARLQSAMTDSLVTSPFIPISRQNVSPVTRSFRYVGVIATSALVFILSLAGLASKSLPGQALYSVKSAFERLALSWQGTPEAEAKYHLTLARARMLEMTDILTASANQAEPVSAKTLKQLTQLSYSVNSELNRASDALNVAVSQASNLAPESRVKIARLVDLAQSVNAQAEQLSVNVANLPVTTNNLAQGANSIGPAQINSSVSEDKSKAVKADPIIILKNNSNKALAVLAATVDQGGNIASKEVKKDLSQSIINKIKAQQEKLSAVKVKTASLTTVEAAQMALDKAEALVKSENYGEAVNQLQLSNSLVDQTETDSVPVKAESVKAEIKAETKTEDQNKDETKDQSKDQIKNQSEKLNETDLPPVAPPLNSSQ